MRDVVSIIYLIAILILKPNIWTDKVKLVNGIYGFMALRKFPRIEIDQRAYDALQAEGILQHRTVREIATEAILGHISTEAIDFIDRKTIGQLTPSSKDIVTDRPQDGKTIETQCRTEGEMIICAPKRKRLADNPVALAKIKEMWTRIPRPSLEKIAEEIGYPKATIEENVKKMKAKGELI